MKKMLSIFGVMLLLVSMSAFAFDVSKAVSVKGDWKWITDAWEQGSFETATYNLEVESADATDAMFVEQEQMGLPWKYDMISMFGANAAGQATHFVSVATVNDPETTPATGGYTQYSFGSHSLSGATTSTLSVSGQGYASISTSLLADAGFSQFNNLHIN
jgi:hypothetical protein